jgi:DNA-binding NarL/FixJ family response regulator
MADVLTFVRDMLFTSKIREVARQLGVSVASIPAKAAADPTALPAPDGETRLVVVDLRLPEALDLLAALANSAAHKELRKIGFIDHERTDVMDAARAAGCSEVMAKGQFSNSLPKLLARVP